MTDGPLKLDVKESEELKTSVESLKQKSKYRNIYRILSSFFVILFVASFGYLAYVNIDFTPKPNYTTTSRTPELFFKNDLLKAPHNYEELISTIGLNEIEAKVILAYSPDSNQTFYRKETDVEVPIASLTKLMSTLIILDNFDPEEEIVVSGMPEEALEHSIGFESGDRVKVEQILNTMLVASYNDAAYVIASAYPGGYEAFVDEMNNRAQKMGMENTQFENPMGLDSDTNYSSANDLRRLITVVLQYPEILEIAKKTEYTLEYVKQNGEIVQETMFNTNQLQGVVANVKGLKTGYTEDAGLCFIGLFGEEGDRVVTIVLDAQDRFLETEQLLQLVQSSYQNLE
jgi:D-alanyl-D-alanine carboxypeptidase